MLRNFFKSQHLVLTLWLPFLVFAAGGSGLHHAPVFGLHGCCGSAHQQVDSLSHNDCGCEAQHAPQDIDSQGHSIAEQSAPCSLCQFFANTHAPVCDELPTELEFVSKIVLETRPSVAVSFPAGFFARGPPVV